MKELSLHILDIVQNSVNANAKLIEISIVEQVRKNSLSIEINDSGYGMNKEMLQKVNDPFFTTGNKKTGMGIPLLKQQAEACGGDVSIYSKEGEGTRIKASFVRNHIDLQPMGDIASTLVGLVRSFPDIDWVYTHKLNDNKFKLDTKQIKEELKGLPIQTPEVIDFLKSMINENLAALSL